MDAMNSPREERFRALFVEHHGAVLRFARRRASPATADDIAADTFLVAWRRLDDVPTRPGEALPWLYAVARQTLLNSHRSDQRREALTVRVADLAGPMTTTLDTDALALRTDLASAWTQLSATDQEALSLALWEDLPSPQAARVLGISSTAYRLRLSRARRSLRRLLEPSPSAPVRRDLRALSQETSS